MIYLDYSATTPVRKEVLESFEKTCLDFIGNSNSLHSLGVASHKLEQSATTQIANLLHIKPEEIIYTSGASESNNLALKGIANQYQNRGKHIITTDLEHSSIYGPCSYLQKYGFEVSIVPTNEFGVVEVDTLKKMIRQDTILVSIASVNSETGLRQPVEEIGRMLRQFEKCFFHVDMTQSIGKVNISLENIDLASFSAHKFYGLKGIGCLIKKEKIMLEPLIHGGKSTTPFRSGTPALPLIVSLAKAMRLSLEELQEQSKKVEELCQFLIEGLKQYPDVTINHNTYCISHILNISTLSIKPETMLHALEENNIFISTQSACSSNHSESRAVYALTKNHSCAEHSLRISLSGLTTKAEAITFLECFDNCYQSLKIR